MRNLTLTVPALILCASVQAQEPAKDASLSERLRTTAPEVQKLIDTFLYEEAFQKAETLVPTTIVPYKGDNPSDAYTSALQHYDYAQAFNIAFKAADRAGRWEKAEEYIKKAQEIAKANKVATEKALNPAIKLYTDVKAEAQKQITGKEAQIADLKKKWKDNTATNQELNDLDTFMIEERKIEGADKLLKTLQFAFERGTRYADSYDSFVEYMTGKLADHKKNIADYAPAKGDPVKWAEAIAGAPKYFDAFPDKADKLCMAFRLKFLAPESAKVQRVLDVMQGKEVAPEPKKPAAKGGKKKG